jgi:hypothetical protein
MSVDKMLVDEMSVDWMIIDEMPWCQQTTLFPSFSCLVLQTEDTTSSLENDLDELAFSTLDLENATTPVKNALCWNFMPKLWHFFKHY